MSPPSPRLDQRMRMALGGAARTPCSVKSSPYIRPDGRLHRRFLDAGWRTEEEEEEKRGRKRHFFREADSFGTIRERHPVGRQRAW